MLELIGFRVCWTELPRFCTKVFERACRLIVEVLGRLTAYVMTTSSWAVLGLVDYSSKGVGADGRWDSNSADICLDLLSRVATLLRAV